MNMIDYQRYPISDEASCRSHLQMLLIGAGLVPRVETHCALGRSDLEVDAGNRHWVFELKYAQNAQQAQKLASHAAFQMTSRNYGVAFRQKEILRAVLVFSSKDRQFTAWKQV